MMEASEETKAAAVAAALSAYQAGALEEAMRLARPLTFSGPAMLVLGNAAMKLGAHLEAGHAFTKAADLLPDHAGPFLKIAANAFIQAEALEPLADIALQAVARNHAHGEDISGFAFTLANHVLKLWSENAKAVVLSLLPYFDQTSGPAMYFAADFYRVTGRMELLKALLDRLHRDMPDNVPINCLRYLTAHDMADLPVIGEHIALMQAPQTPFTQALLAGEQALARLNWCDDPVLQAKPTLDQRLLAQSLAQKPARRIISAAGQRLKIGYLSGDFHGHAMMTLFLDSLISHDFDRYEISLFCYSPKDKAGQMPAPLDQHMIYLQDMDDVEAAADIDRRGIDILIDIKGLTPGNRLGIINLSSAPIKATFLGFPGPQSGVDLDYTIVDPIIAPDKDAPWFHEKFCRLPETYQANSTFSRPKAKMQARSNHGLPEDAFVFCSFNGVQKVTPQTLQLWAKVLHAVPCSLFWIMCPKALARENLLAAFKAEGIGPERIVFADRMDYNLHVSRLPLADLALDTFPYNGHTTTSDMLWAGLPVLSKKGNSFVSRVSESLLTALGMPELVAEDEAEFVRLARHYSEDREAYRAMRQKLEALRDHAPLFDCVRFARHMEAAFEAMAQRARQGLAPAQMDIAARPLSADYLAVLQNTAPHKEPVS